MNVGVLPVTGFPHEGGKAKEGLRVMNNSDTKQTRASHTPHNIRSRKVVSAVIPSKRANGTVLIRCQVEEVDILGTSVVEVEVHNILTKITAAVVVPMLSSNLMEPMSSRVVLGSSRTRKLVGSTVTVVVHGARDSRFFGQG